MEVITVMRTFTSRSLGTALLIVSTLVPSSIVAQPATVTRHGASGRGAFQVGYMTLDLGELNTSLVAAGLPQLEEQYLTLGGSGFGAIGRFMIGGEGAGLIGQHRATPTGSYDVSLDGGYGLFRIGYNVVTSEVLDVYPTLGIGGAGTQLEIKGRSAPTFGEVITDPARSSRLTNGGFLLAVGVDADYRVNLGTGPNGEYGGMLIGISTGYLFCPQVSDWTLDGMNSVAGGPRVKVEGFYVKLSIGGWGRRPPSP